jgi:hypothetical protein
MIQMVGNRRCKVPIELSHLGQLRILALGDVDDEGRMTHTFVLAQVADDDISRPSVCNS